MADQQYGEVLAVLAGAAAPLGESGRMSAIDKQIVTGPVAVGPEGLLSDVQADRRAHGGIDKAVHQYPIEHYPFWQAHFQQQQPLLNHPGAFGENLHTRGMTEETVCIGDRYRLGSVELEVSQPRQPCWKLNVRFNAPDMARLVQQTCCTGWYYRVLQPGEFVAGDRLILLDRPNSAWSLRRLQHFLYRDNLNVAALEEIARLPALAAKMRELANKRLALKAVEDWQGRLSGPVATP